MNLIKFRKIFTLLGILFSFFPVFVSAQGSLAPGFLPNPESCREPSYSWGSYMQYRDCTAAIASCQAITNTRYIHDRSTMPSTVTCLCIDADTCIPTDGSPITTGGGDSPGEFKPLVNIGIDPELGFGAYINAVYLLSISIAALLAVIKIIVAGVKWMLTDLVNAKGEAKKDIQGALLGLLIIISAHVILTTVNPELIEFKMLPPAEVTTP